MTEEFSCQRGGVFWGIGSDIVIVNTQTGETKKLTNGRDNNWSPLRYIANSPFFRLDRVQTPLLILHGTGADTVRSDGSDEVFVGLRRLGKKVVYARYDGEGHAPVTWRRPNQIDYLNRVLRWFGEHLKASQ